MPEAIFEAGGFQNTADRSRVVLIRRGPNDLPMLTIFDLTAFAADGTPTGNTILRASDIVVVQTSAVAKLNLCISQHDEPACCSTRTRVPVSSVRDGDAQACSAAIWS